MLHLRNKVLNRSNCRARCAAGIFAAVFLFFTLLQFTLAPGIALAGTIRDVIEDVATNLSEAEFQFGSESVTGMNMGLHACVGEYSNGGASIAVVGPADSSQMTGLLDYVASQAGSSGTKTSNISGCEVREYRMSGGAAVGVLLPEYLVTVEIYESGNGTDWEVSQARHLAQLTLDGLERAGVLNNPAPQLEGEADTGSNPDIYIDTEEESPGLIGTIKDILGLDEEDTGEGESTPEIYIDTEEEAGNFIDMIKNIFTSEDNGGKAGQAIPKAEPVQVSNTNNIAGVQSGPTVPTTFTINQPHLVTFIQDYHWNSAQGAAPGTIALQDQNGVLYGPWQVTTRDGQGGVKNAYWEVWPDVVIPAGTYTIIDSDPATWSQNAESGGRGMGEVRATPYFEVVGGTVDSGSDSSNQQPWDSCNCEPQAGIGSVGNIPGPETTTEAVVGVVAPGLISVALGALGALGGGGGPIGGMQIPPGGSGPMPGSGGSYPSGSYPGQSGAGAYEPAAGMGKGRKPEEYGDGMYIETEQEAYRPGGTNGDGTYIETAQEAYRPGGTNGDGTYIETAQEAYRPGGTNGDGIYIETEQEAYHPGGQEAGGILIDSAASVLPGASGPAAAAAAGGISIDTDAVAGAGVQPAAAEQSQAVGGAAGSSAAQPGTGLGDTGPGPEQMKTDQEASGLTDKSTADATYDPEGYDQQGYDQNGYDRDGYNIDGFNKDGFDQNGFDKEGYNIEGRDKEGFDREGYDVPGYDRDGFDDKGFDREGYNSAGFDKDGFNKEGFDKYGYDSDGYDAEGFNREHYDREGFDQSGYDKEGYDREGLNHQGYDREGYNTEGFDRQGYDREGFNRDGYNSQGYDHDGYNREGYDLEGYNKDGYNRSGYDREGYDRDGYHQDGYDEEGFDRNGYDKEGFDHEGYDKNGFNQDGFDKEGFDREGFDSQGYNHEGYDKNGFNQEGFDKDGFNRDGYDQEGYNKDGFGKEGLDREGYDKEGFNLEGYDREGFDRNGFDSEGYSRSGFDQNGYDREGYDVNGYDEHGYNRSGYDAKGYDKGGYDKNGFDKEGWDRDGYGRNGLNKDGFDREGYDKNGYDAEGYDREGYNRDGLQREGYDEYGYDKNGFNKDGFDRDGYDMDGFNYEGYSRAGYDPWGFDRHGYGKDGYHWSGYNADGYNRDGWHWSDNPYEGDSPFNVDTRNPFEENADITPTHEVEMDADGNIIGGRSLAESWKPTKPPLGEPYPRTLEKYGAKPWTEEPTTPVPGDDKSVSIPDTKDDSGFVPGPEDPMGTLEHHDVGQTPGVSDSAEMPDDRSIPQNIPEEDWPESGGDIPEAGDIPGQEPGIADSDTFTVTDPATGETTTYEYPEGYTGPRHGDSKILVGKTDGQTYEIGYDATTGRWVNKESGNWMDPDDFDRWQNDLAEDKRRSEIDLEKMSKREDANSKAIDKNLKTFDELNKMEESAIKHGVGNKGGPGDVEKAIEDMKQDMLDGKEVDADRMEQIKRIIKGKIRGDWTEDTGERWEEDPWYEDIGSALKANADTFKELVTGQDSDGNISWLGMGGRIAMAAATGGATEYGMTVAEAMFRIQESVDKGESDFRAVAKAIGMVIMEESVSRYFEGAAKLGTDEMARRFPALTNKVADIIETGVLKVLKADQAVSSKLGMIGREGAEETIDQINKRLADLGSDAAEEGTEQMIKGTGKGAAGTADELGEATAKSVAGTGDEAGEAAAKSVAGTGDEAGEAAAKSAAGTGDEAGEAAAKSTAQTGDEAGEAAAKSAAGTGDEAGEAAAKSAAESGDKAADAAGKATQEAGAQAEDTVKQNVKDFDKLPDKQKAELIESQQGYDEYVEAATNKGKDLANKVQNGEAISEADLLNMKSDPAAMRKFKELSDLPEAEAHKVQTAFNEAIDEKIYKPTYGEVETHIKGNIDEAALKAKYGEDIQIEVTVETIRTPGKEYHSYDINTDNDIHSVLTIKDKHGNILDVKEVPRGDWEDVYFKSYSKNTGMVDGAGNFNTNLAKERYPDVEWDKMANDADKCKAWAELHEEAPTDVYHPEAARDFSTEKTAILNGKAPEEAAAAAAKHGRGTLMDAQQLGQMETYKIGRYWNEGSVKSQTEALEQLGKLGNQTKGLEQGYFDMGYDIKPMPPKMEEALNVVKNRSLAPETRAARLQELGFDGPTDLANKLASRIHSLPLALPKK